MSQQAQPPSTKPKVAVSYSWKEEREGGNKDKCKDLRSSLEKAGIEVVYDAGTIRPGDSIKQFMRHLAGQAHLCILLSRGYLESEDCMFELLRAWQASLSDPERFRLRAKVLVLEGVHVDRPEERIP
ncbi:MAG: Leucinerich repeat domain, partial [Verrucomicrobiota bacterium]